MGPDDGAETAAMGSPGRSENCRIREFSSSFPLKCVKQQTQLTHQENWTLTRASRGRPNMSAMAEAAASASSRASASSKRSWAVVVWRWRYVVRALADAAARAGGLQRELRFAHLRPKRTHCAFVLVLGTNIAVLLDSVFEVV